MKMTDLLGGVLGNSSGLLEHLQGDQTRQAGLADLLTNLGAEQTKPDGNILDQIGGLLRGSDKDNPDDFLDLLDQAGGKKEGMDKTTGLGAAATLALNMMMGRDASGFAGRAVKMGGVAALGTAALKAFQGWQKGGSSQAQALGAISPAVHDLSDDDAEQRAEALLVAMVSAAKADEHIDDAEEARLIRAFEQSGMDDSAQQFFIRELRTPLDAGRVASMADDLETAAELYAATLLVVDDMNAAERSYLMDLKDKMGLPSELAANLEKEIKA